MNSLPFLLGSLATLPVLGLTALWMKLTRYLDNPLTDLDEHCSQVDVDVDARAREEQGVRVFLEEFDAWWAQEAAR